MTDRELLEMAAKAAGIELVGLVDQMICQPDHRTGGFIIRNERGGDSCWNPLNDDGDALRLAVKLGMSIEVHTDLSQPKPWLRIVYEDSRWWHVSPEDYELDPYGATRKAIVCAAAEIGKDMK